MTRKFALKVVLLKRSHKINLPLLDSKFVALPCNRIAIAKHKKTSLFKMLKVRLVDWGHISMGVIYSEMYYL